MTPEELKALVAAKIAGQGTNVDAGGGLPEILNGIIDLVAGQQLPVASAEQLGGVKVGSGLDITTDGVLSAGGGALVVPVVLDFNAHTATINPDSTITKQQVHQTLTTGRPVVGLDERSENTFCCCGISLGDADGGAAVFFYINPSGEIVYCTLPSLMMD